MYIGKVKDFFPLCNNGGDIGKSQIKQFCQQYTRNVTMHIIRSLQDLEIEVVDLQHLVYRKSRAC